MDIKGYVNPRSLGNNEPNQFLKLDLFIEDELWAKFIDKNGKAVLRTWDVTWMFRVMCRAEDIEKGTARFDVKLGSKNVKLRGY